MEKTLKGTVFAFLLIVGILSLTACSTGELKVEGDGTGTVTIIAKEKTSAVTVASLEADQEFVEIAPSIEEGDMMISITDGESILYKSVTLDSSSNRRELFEVDSGAVAITVDAHEAKGEVTIQGVTVLDGPGTAGS